jgi:hypothetical protein
VVVLALAACLVAGCAGIPSSGPVVAAEPGDGTPPGLIVRQDPNPPPPGADPVQIVTGFLAAGEEFADSHALARQYLSEVGSATWASETKAALYDPEQRSVSEVASARTTRTAQVRLVAALAATISEDGEYRAAPSGARFDRTFDLVREDGQWRIAAVPYAGVVLAGGAALALSNPFLPVDVYFLTPGGGQGPTVGTEQTMLVPERIQVVRAAGSPVTQAAASLLGGAGPWLAPAVRTAVPAGTALAAPVVVTSDGVAVVRLSDEVLAATGAQRRDLCAQLVWTLTQFVGVREVTVQTRTGALLEVPGAPERQGREDWAAYDPAGPIPGEPMWLVRDGRVRAVVPEDGGLVQAVPGEAGGLTATAAAYSPARESRVRRHAVVVPEPGGQTLREGVDDLVTRVRAAAVWSVTYDRYGRVMALARAADGSVRLLTGEPGTAALLPVALPAGLGVPIRVRLARDGRRVAVVADVSGRRSVYLGRVSGSTGVPRVDGFIAIAPSLTSVADVAWRDASMLVVLGSDDAGRQVRPIEVTIDGAGVQLFQPPAGARLQRVAVAPGRPVVVGDQARVWLSRGNGWQAASALDGATEITYGG